MAIPDTAALKQKYNLTYHIDYLLYGEQLIGLKGKKVLEVGGSLPEGLVIGDLQAAQWLSLEEIDYWTESLSTGHLQGTPPELQGEKKLFAQADPAQFAAHNLCFGRIEELPEALTGYFDAIFSIAAFEHIAKLPLALEKMAQALRPGGKLYALFGPLWSSYNGHHLPEIEDRAGNRWSFSNSPVPPWAHLLVRPMELFDFLCSKTDPETAREIVYFVYSSPHINRFFLDDYREIVARSSFTTLQCTPMFPVNMQPPVQERLEAMYPGRKNFDHSSLLLVLEKPVG
ncbi:methyltransferase domain-containing protein [Geomesophilobacter sediminis]|uniref:Methyltransferase domain-containing protein n=1 Tax=Geomesophilobacter sediminis TaxID=2798584 RepID=A0A8J7SBF5_9BACT|nr:methyltransferase domain-containing protein [Geomesophilobacter sediminis]MBJ6727761.1 methyltransferase domain-containing protein [Geomesophilobacter sediminis]